MKVDYTYGENVERLYQSVSIHIERITPDVAEEMLKANVHNRNMSREPLKNAIMNGEWKLNGAAIVFSDDGVLLDGQHRLKACVDTGIPIDTIVVRGVSHYAQITMDTGKKRNVVDYLKLLGFKSCTCVAAIGSVMQRADKYGIGSSLHKANGDQFTVESTVNYIIDNYDERIAPIVRDSDNVKRRYKGVGSGTVGVILDRLRMGGAQPDDIDDFLRQLRGVTTPTQSVYVLQQRLERNANDKMGKLPQEYIAAFIVKTWNAYIRGDDLKILKYAKGGANPQQFPQIVIQ